jgi:hypothetical protein
MKLPAMGTNGRSGLQYRIALLLALALAFAAALAYLIAELAAPAAADASFQLGLQDGGFQQPTAQPYAGVGNQAMKVINGNTVRIELDWATVAPATPGPGFDASDPGDPQYNWSALDQAIRSAARQNVRILVDVLDAPAWAEGPREPSAIRVHAGAWDPSPTEFGQFVHAVAQRYGGQFADPAQPGTFLPRVSYWELWNEENLPIYLAAPDLVGEYRALLNSGYRAIKSVHPDDVVVVGGFAPVSFLPPYSMPALSFAARLLCLTRVGHSFRRARSCPSKTNFDVFSYHPYSLAATPTKPAYNSNDVLIADAGKVANLVHTADRLHTAGGPSRHPIWVTEFAWFTNPPNKAVGDRPATAARYIAYSMYEMARADVSLLIWQTVMDRPDLGILGGGLYASSGRAKPTLRALAFPFVAIHQGSGGAAWGRAPASGGRAVVIQRWASRRWVRVAGARTAGDGEFSAHFRMKGNSFYRAVVTDGPQSLTYYSAPIPRARTR